MRRMDRYSDEVPAQKRSERNQELYQDFQNNPRYTNVTDIVNSNAYELNQNSQDVFSREAYQQRMKYQGVPNPPRIKKELDNFNYLYQQKEKKVYDINSVLEDARKNRVENDHLEEKRKLKYTSYNIFSGMNLEELAKYREEKKKRQETPEEKEIRGFMDTIASRTLAGEMSKDETVELLSDLMATSIMDRVSSPDEIETLETTILDPKKIEDTVEEEEEIPIEEDILPQADTSSIPDIRQEDIERLQEEEGSLPNSSEIDDSFYTKSMDLSNEDIEMSDDFEERGLPVVVKIFIFIIIFSIIAIAAFFVYQRLK